MRISDWSSDVCSSDLHRQLRLRIGIITDQYDPAACEEGRIQPVSQRKILLRLDLGTIEGGFRRIGEAARHRVAVVNYCVCFDRIVDLLRSEEHTSELQSLMRISYAVFCLKKNTNKLI